MLGLLYEYIIKLYESERFRKPEWKRIDTNEIWYSNGNILSIPIYLNIAIEVFFSHKKRAIYMQKCHIIYENRLYRTFKDYWFTKTITNQIWYSSYTNTVDNSPQTHTQLCLTFFASKPYFLNQNMYNRSTSIKVLFWEPPHIYFDQLNIMVPYVDRVDLCHSFAILWEIYVMRHKYHVRWCNFHFKWML